MSLIPNNVTCAEVRKTIIEIAALCGEAAHIGGSLSMVELLNALYANILRHNPSMPEWAERDIFILSKGHCVLGYFAILSLYGYFPREKLESFQTNGSDLIAHPVKNISLGIESSNGSLGQGLSYGLGVALGMNKRAELHRRVFVMLGDGECNEGSIWETAALAAELKVNNLFAIVDENKLRNDGANSLFEEKDGAKLANIWRAFGWNVVEVDGHDYDEILDAYKKLISQSDRPGVIVANTIKGKGIDFMEANNDWHHNRITEKLFQECLSKLQEQN